MMLNVVVIKCLARGIQVVDTERQDGLVPNSIDDVGGS